MQESILQGALLPFNGNSLMDGPAVRKSVVIAERPDKSKILCQVIGTSTDEFQIWCRQWYHSKQSNGHLPGRQGCR